MQRRSLALRFGFLDFFTTLLLIGLPKFILSFDLDRLLSFDRRIKQGPGSLRMRVAFESRILQCANNSLFRWND